MSEAVEGGVIAWRLLATLEGGSLLLAASALLAYTATYRFVRNNRRTTRLVKTVLITNIKNKLGSILKQRLESCGCVVSTMTSDAISGAGSDQKVDALIVVGSELDAQSLEGISDLVTEDVYSNLKLLESLSPRVNRGGSIAWASAGQRTKAGAFKGPAAAFDNVLHTTLQHVAKLCHCNALWIGRYDGAERTAEQLIAALMTDTTPTNLNRSSVRNAAIKVGEYLYKCLKTVT